MPSQLQIDVSINYSKIAAKFHYRFPNLELSKLLSDISVPKSYMTIIPKDQKDFYLEVLTFLLREKIVVQLHMYLYYLVPEETLNYSKTSINISQTGPLMISSLKKYKDTILSAPRTPKNLAQTSSSHIFERLIPYLNGEFNVEEILYREKISR